VEEIDASIVCSFSIQIHFIYYFSQMKKAMILLALLEWVGIISGNAQNRVPAFEMNARLGRGINMGNSFEAPSETEWGNPWKPEYFKIISELGFDHVRLPVRWEPETRSIASAPFTINQTFLLRIQEVVDEALKNNLYIIINMHHHDLLLANPDSQKERFLAQWYQIADYFKNYSDKLLFEVLNEPHGGITPVKWNDFFSAALTEIRKTNPTRVVLMGVAEFGGLGGIPQLDLPADEYLILSPHYYNPFTFTHQGAEWVGAEANQWLGTKWNDTEAERETVLTEFKAALEFSATNKIPIHVGEFGAYNTADIESRARWTTFLARWFEEQNISWAYWEFSAGFGIYNPTSKQFNSSLVDALLFNEMPQPTPLLSIPVYTSNFQIGTDGWNLSAQGGAAATVMAANSKLAVSITSGGSELWHLQLIKNNLAFQKNRMYRISFKAQATANRSVTFYAGKASDPWNAYSGYATLSVGTNEDEYALTFMMTSASDPAARLVFDLGKSSIGIVVSSVKVEELQFLITTIEETPASSTITIYPNPVSTFFHIKDLAQFDQINLFDLKGQSMTPLDVDLAASSINIERFPKGIYLLRLSENGRIHSAKIAKE